VELTAKIYNINEGRNPEILRRSETLDGYSAFVAKEREYEAELSGGGRRVLTENELRTAMTQAIQWCIAHNKIKRFLESNSSEVLNMLITEWNWDKYVEVREREAVEAGLIVGRREGREEGLMKGREKRNEEIARSALMEGLPVETIRKITGLDTDTIQRLANR
jgi:DNA-directed RNA polymerase specialized sigma24 family protein